MSSFKRHTFRLSSDIRAWAPLIPSWGLSNGIFAFKEFFRPTLLAASFCDTAWVAPISIVNPPALLFKVGVESTGAILIEEDCICPRDVISIDSSTHIEEVRSGRRGQRSATDNTLSMESRRDILGIVTLVPAVSSSLKLGLTKSSLSSVSVLNVLYGGNPDDEVVFASFTSPESSTPLGISRALSLSTLSCPSLCPALRLSLSD
mmetsp:Transcript_12582/g.20439  ORF Transcript_12582/g.20439 Transcript_12582/m.20439 type:complete len:205 (+) Transcript_12582:1084-1698(+)